MKVVLLSLDSVRSDFFGPESETDGTSTIDRICREGLYFPNTIVQAPFTAPSHGAMLTGLYPYRNGIRNFDGALRPGVDSIFDHMEEEGFDTNVFLGSGMLKNRGFDWEVEGFETLDNVLPALERESDSFTFIHYWNTHTPYKARMPNTSVKNFAANVYLKLSETLGLKRGYMGPNDNPARNLWRLGYKYFWSHRMEEIRDLMAQDEEDTARRMEEGYRKSIREADRYIEALLERLESGEEDFVLIVTSDHGESFNENGERGEFREFEHGWFLHQNAVKVPTVVYGSGIDTDTREGVVRSVDIVPTICDLAGSIECDLDGTSLFEERSRIAYSEVHRPPDAEKKSVQDENEKLIRVDDENSFYSFPGESRTSRSERLLEALENHLEEEEEGFESSKEEQIQEQLEKLGYR